MGIFALLNPKKRAQKRLEEQIYNLKFTLKQMQRQSEKCSKQRFRSKQKCKDAMTMNDFVNNLTLSFDDLAITKEKGLCQGIINIMTKNLKELSVYERPMHCTDIKREIVYIKSAGDIIGGKEEPAKWEKDNKNRLLKQAIDKASHIQRINLQLWRDEHPNWETDSDEQIEYMTLVRNSMEDIKEKKNEDKVIKKLCGITHLTDKI